ncbi:MAG TPA: VOC family protein, partial [Burkholderiaceae bacterium]
DRARMAAFYERAFGWDLHHLGAEMGDYVMAMTTASTHVGPSHPGVINGGLFPRRADMPAQHPSVVLAVQEIGAAMQKVTQAGGKVLGEPMEIPGVGQYVAFIDTEGNQNSMLQPQPMGDKPC